MIHTRNDFFRYFATQPGILAKRTNHNLVNMLFEAITHEKQLVYEVHQRASGCTTTLMEFARWYGIGRCLFLTNAGLKSRFEDKGFLVRTWRQSLQGLRRELVLIDSPIAWADMKSPITLAKFNHVLRKIKQPFVYVDSTGVS
jgi:hypothetical protein